MQQNKARIKLLLEKYTEHTATQDEIKELYKLLEQKDFKEVEDIVAEMMDNQKPLHDSERTELLLRKILEPAENSFTENEEAPIEVLYPEKKIRRINWVRIVAAAIIILIIGAGAYFNIIKPDSKDLVVTQNNQSNDVAAPGQVQAVITLADGRKIVLDSTGSGTIAMEGSVNVSKNQQGEIIYTASGTENNELQYNILFNPRGSKIVGLVLSDGTKVWLNSESSLRYPTAFSGNERKVEITGEAYFEVTKQKQNVKGKIQNFPFLVTANGVITEVLGTQFNVNAFDDETAVRITLLEGSVKVAKGNDYKLLKPGQQARLPIAEDHIYVAGNVVVSEVMAWKNGMFHFNDVDIQTMMRQIARWYNVEVEYRGIIPQRSFRGEIDRNVPVSKVLQMLEFVGISFKIEGNPATGKAGKIVVLP